MQRFLSKYSDTLYALMRLIVGFLFTCHGAQKLFGVLGGHAQPLMSLIGLAGILEFFGGLLVAVGFFAGYAAFIASGLMATAYFMSHASQGLLPIQNHGELAVVYCFVFLYIASRGSGRWSVDRRGK